MWSDRAPDVIDALLLRFAASSDLGAAVPPVQVFDGPTVIDESSPEVLMVGWSGADGEESDAESTMSPDGLATTDREVCTVRCAISVLNGSTDMALPRARAYELLRFAGAALAADRSLGGTVLRAMITSVAYTPRQTTRGAQVDLVFTVECDAFTNR